MGKYLGENRDKIALYWLGLTVLLLPAYLVRFKIFGIPTTLLEVNIYLMVLTVAVLYWGKWGDLWSVLKRKMTVGFWVGVALIMVGAVAGVIVSPERMAALGLFKAYFIDALLVFAMVLMFVRTKRDRMVLLEALGLVTVWAGIWAILQHFGVVAAKAPWSMEHPQRVNSFFEYPNAVSLFCAPIVALFSGMLLYGKDLSKGEKIFCLSVVLFGFAAIALALSRGALVAVFGVMLLFSLFSPRRWWGLAVLAVAAGVVLFDSAIRERMVYAFSGGDFSAFSRSWYWKASWIEVTEKWLWGVGLAGFPDAMKELIAKDPSLPRFLPNYLYPHNILDNFWLTLGLPGLVGFIVVIGSFFGQIWKNWSKLGKGIGAGLATALIVWLLYGVVEVPYFKNDLAIQFWVLIGIAMMLKEQSEGDKKTSIK